MVKIRFYFKTKKKVPMVTKPRGWGVKALVAGPLKMNLFFFAASLTSDEDNCIGFNIVMNSPDLVNALHCDGYCGDASILGSISMVFRDEGNTLE